MCARLFAFAVLATTAPFVLGAGGPPRQPKPEDLPRLATELVVLLEERAAALPDGSTAPVLSLVKPEQIEPSLGAVQEAEAWPAAWLVIQDLAQPLDLLLPIRFDEDGHLVIPDTPLAAPRREWDHAGVTDAFRAAAGRKPRERVVNIVVQSFSTKTVQTYVYETPAAAPAAGGLLALLPPRSILREARSVDLGDGQRHTLALAIQDAQFVPSDCSSGKARLLGHADSGRVLLVLAGEQALEHTLDLTPQLKGPEGRPLVPRYACLEGDETTAAPEGTMTARFRDRPTVPLLELSDLDGDGLALEVVLLAGIGDGDVPRRLVVAVGPTAVLRVVP